MIPDVPAPTDSTAAALWHTYMKAAGDALRALSPDQRDEMLRELASHLADSVASGEPDRPEVDRVRDAIDRLGDPRDVLRPLIADALLERGTRTYDPRLLARGLYAGLYAGARALATTIAFVIGYIVLIAFALMVLLKAFLPRHVGYFAYPDGAVSFGIARHSAGARDVLGYWIVPIALMGVALLYFALTRLFRVVRGPSIRTAAHEFPLTHRGGRFA